MRLVCKNLGTTLCTLTLYHFDSVPPGGKVGEKKRSRAGHGAA
jgi:hypothetical protein